MLFVTLHNAIMSLDGEQLHKDLRSQSLRFV